MLSFSGITFSTILYRTYYDKNNADNNNKAEAEVHVKKYLLLISIPFEVFMQLSAE